MDVLIKYSLGFPLNHDLELEGREEDAGRVLDRGWLENNSYIYRILVKPPFQK